MDVLKKVPVREQDPRVRAANFEEVCLGYNQEEAVYAGGDAVTGAATVILAMEAGRAGARGIHEYLGGEAE